MDAVEILFCDLDNKYEAEQRAKKQQEKALRNQRNRRR